MKVAILSHFYPPAPGGGAMIYAATLAESLRRMGHDSSVLCAGKWGVGAHYFNGYSDDVQQGVPVRRLHINWKLAPRPFDYLGDSPVLATHIHDYLLETQPDLVHIISCYTLSARAICASRQLGLPTVVHLVDMWFICPRHTLLRKNGELCYGAQDDWDCQRCMLWGTKALRVSNQIAVDGQQRRILTRLGQISPVTRLPGLRGMLGDMHHRRQFTLEALQHAQAILAPSHAIQQLYETNGVPPHRIRHLPYGHDVSWAKDIEHQPALRLRFGFLGNVIPIKGVHVLVDAFQRLDPSADVELHIYGYDGGDQAYTNQLKRRATTNVVFHGQYARADLPRLFSNLDVVVVPSIWHENNPLVIQEAFAAGCPVIVSDMSGAAEAVRDEIDGLHFKTGDAVDLARQMTRLLSDRGLLPRLRRAIRPVRTTDEELHDLLAVYQSICKPAATS